MRVTIAIAIHDINGARRKIKAGVFPGEK